MYKDLLKSVLASFFTVVLEGSVFVRSNVRKTSPFGNSLSPSMEKHASV